MIAEQCQVNCIRRLFLDLLENMAVDIHRDLIIRMTQALLCDLRGDSGGEHDGRVDVPKIVQTDVLQSVSFQKAAKFQGERIALVRRSVKLTNDVVIRFRVAFLIGIL